MTAIRNFEAPAIWSNPDGTLTERARGFLRSLFDYIGASAGTLPVESIGGDGVSTTSFLREDGSFAVPNYPVGADPSASLGLSAVNGSAATFMRSDGAPALSQGIAPTWTAVHTYSATPVFNAGITTTTVAMTGALTGATSLTTTGGITTGSATLHTTTTALTNGAAAAAGTLLNAPTAGNPTKWVPINDNGTTRFIPAW